MGIVVSFHEHVPQRARYLLENGLANPGVGPKAGLQVLRMPFGHGGMCRRPSKQAMVRRGCSAKKRKNKEKRKRKGGCREGSRGCTICCAFTWKPSWMEWRRRGNTPGGTAGDSSCDKSAGHMNSSRIGLPRCTHLNRTRKRMVEVAHGLRSNFPGVLGSASVQHVRLACETSKG